MRTSLYILRENTSIQVALILHLLVALGMWTC